VKNCRPHGRGWELYTRVGGELITDQREQKPDVQAVRDWIAATRGAVKKRTPGAFAGTFAADAEQQYFPAVAAMPTYRDRVNEIKSWYPAFGDRPRSSITALEIRQQMERWLIPPDRCVSCRGKIDPLAPDAPPDAPAPRCARCGDVGGPGYAAQTVRNRRTALLHLWNTLDGKSERNPVRDAPPPRKTDPEPRGRSYVDMIAIINAMPDRGRAAKDEKRSAVSLTKIRCRVLLWTGLPAAQLRRMDWRRDLYLDAGYAIVQGRKKGGGTKARRLELNPNAIAALKQLIKAGGLGSAADKTLQRSNFSTSSMWKSFQRAAAKLDLHDLRPYDFRHSFLTAVYVATGDINATATAGDHSTLDLTRRYVLAARDLKQVDAMTRFHHHASSQLSANFSKQSGRGLRSVTRSAARVSVGNR
jgi:integrase